MQAHHFGLNPAATELRVVYGSVAKDDQEIAILSRSILDMLVELASYIDEILSGMDRPRGLAHPSHIRPGSPPEDCAIGGGDDQWLAVDCATNCGSFCSR